MTQTFAALAAGSLLAAGIALAPSAQAAGYADCFTASGRVGYSQTEYVLEIRNNCQFGYDIPLGTTAFYSFTIGGGFCGQEDGTLFLSGFGPTERIDLSCLRPGYYTPQLTIRSFNDGSSNFITLSSFQVVAASPTPTPTPRPTPSRTPLPLPTSPSTPPPSKTPTPLPPLPPLDSGNDDDEAPYGLYSRGGSGETCVVFPNGDEDDECVDGSHWGYRTCYASAKGARLEVLRDGKWRPVQGRFARNDGCDGFGYTWTVDVHVKEKRQGTRQYRIVNPAQAGFKRNVTRMRVTVLR